MLQECAHLQQALCKLWHAYKGRVASIFMLKMNMMQQLHAYNMHITASPWIAMNFRVQVFCMLTMGLLQASSCLQ